MHRERWPLLEEGVVHMVGEGTLDLWDTLAPFCSQASCGPYVDPSGKLSNLGLMTLICLTTLILKVCTQRGNLEYAPLPSLAVV